jgi:hypothetical protein
MHRSYSDAIRGTGTKTPTPPPAYHQSSSESDYDQQQVHQPKYFNDKFYDARRKSRQQAEQQKIDEQTTETQTIISNPDVRHNLTQEQLHETRQKDNVEYQIWLQQQNTKQEIKNYHGEQRLPNRAQTPPDKRTHGNYVPLEALLLQTGHTAKILGNKAMCDSLSPDDLEILQQMDEANYQKWIRRHHPHRQDDHHLKKISHQPPIARPTKPNDSPPEIHSDNNGITHMFWQRGDQNFQDWTECGKCNQYQPKEYYLNMAWELRETYLSKDSRMTTMTIINLKPGPLSDYDETFLTQPYNTSECRAGWLTPANTTLLISIGHAKIILNGTRNTNLHSSKTVQNTIKFIQSELFNMNIYVTTLELAIQTRIQDSIAFIPWSPLFMTKYTNNRPPLP